MTAALAVVDPPAALALTAAKTNQDAISAAALAELAGVMPLLVPDDAVATTQGWLQQVLQLISRYRQRSVAQAMIDYNKLRLLVTGDHATFTPRGLPVPDTGAVVHDLLVSGPGRAMQSLKMPHPDTLVGIAKASQRAAAAALVHTAFAVNEHVLNGGRDATLTAITQDSQARYGATRVARPDACGFCKMLTANTYTPAHVGFAAHGKCRCVAGPKFRVDQPVPAAQRAAQELWAATTKGLYGKAALSKFRAVSDGREWQGWESKPSARGVITKVAPDGTQTAWRDGGQLSRGHGSKPAAKSTDASPAGAVPTDGALKSQYAAEHAALSKTVGSTKSDAARKYQTDRIAQLSRMMAAL